jgi:transcriptional regulator with XRE-family HTH domain
MVKTVVRPNVVAAEPELSHDHQALGDEIRKLRKARGKSLAELAQAIGRSTSYVSQVERGGAEPSIADLRGIAQSLGVPLGWFFLSEEIPAAERGRVVRAESRRRLGSFTDGLVEELLSPSIGPAFETFLSTFAPGAALPQATQRDTEEEGYIVKGILDLWIGEQQFRLGPGDSFHIRGEPFRWVNPGTEETVAVWVIAPPIY